MGCPCSCLPSLATPSLADATADAVDSASVRFFAASALAARRKDEAEERRRSTEERCSCSLCRLLSGRPSRSAGSPRSAQSLWPPSQPGRRNRKKKRKKSFLGVLFLDKVVDVSVIINDKFLMMQRQVPTVHSFMLPVQFLDTVLTSRPGLLRLTSSSCH